MSDQEKLETPPETCNQKKNLKSTWAGLEPKTQFWLKISSLIIAALVVFTGGFATGYERAKSDFRNAIEDAFSGFDLGLSEEPVEEVVEEDALSEEGSRSNPAPMGTTVYYSDASGDVWEVTLSDPILNANDIIAAENQFNEPAPEGFQYAMVTVTAKYVGKETGTPFWDLEVTFVSESGTTHTSGDVYAAIPNPLIDVNELYPDAVGVGNVAVAVPSANVEAGNWVVSIGFGDAKYFFQAQ